ncbi:hypothetical protein PAPHI01_1421 [Pancytospora philotis]|nr:hypothetical protein PAPHI01_1421 [Pancytospora philotis]
MSELRTGEDQLAEQQLKFCAGLLTKLKRNQNAGPFLKPVDAEALGIPDYPEKIKHPMDISTVKKNLESGAYKAPEEFHGDMTLMFDNCYLYNAPGSVVHEMGKDLQKAFEALYRELPAEAVKKAKPAPSPRAVEKPRAAARDGIAAGDAAYCADVLGELEKAKHRKCTWPFLQPVTDADAPGYSEAITRPMDLGTMRKKLDARAYVGVSDFNDDLELIVDNCYKFNAPGSEVYVCCEEFERLARGLMHKQQDPDVRINELRRKISALTAELSELERTKSQTRRVFGLADRERIGKAVVRMTRPQAEQVAEIVQRHCVFEYVDNDEIEINMNTIPDEVVGEINEYIAKIGGQKAVE